MGQNLGALKFQLAELQRRVAALEARLQAPSAEPVVGILCERLKSVAAADAAVIAGGAAELEELLNRLRDGDLSGDGRPGQSEPDAGQR